MILIATQLLLACSRQGGRPKNTQDETIDFPGVPVKTPGLSFNENSIEQTTIDEKGLENTKINIFIENSGSMNGFINSASNYQNAITALTSRLKNAYGKENLSLSFINAIILPQQGDDPYQVVNEMLVSNHFRNQGATSSTDLNKLIKLVLDNTNKNELSFFISDCIYSIQDRGATPTLLGGCQNGTMDVFSEKLKLLKDLSVLFVRMESNFDGKYWDYLHPTGTASQTIHNQNRPYYICVIGADNHIKEFCSKINIEEELEGFGQSYYLIGKDLSKTFYTVVSKPYNRGLFVVEDKETVYIRREGELRFAIAINLDELPISELDKTNVDNYEIDGDFVLEEIAPIDRNTLFSPREKNMVLENGCTHLLVVSANGYPSDFSIKIKQVIPTWIDDFSSEDDTNISDNNQRELKKTFGISYFIKGAAAAYKRDGYFVMNIKIKH